MQHEDLSIISLVLNASVVVQIILVLLVSLSVASWSIIIRKGFALGSVKRATEEFEKSFWSGGDLNTLLEAGKNQKNMRIL
jgi:biopolymer transport protein TolQ